MHGKGLLVWPDGKSYEGDFREDKRDGVGIFKWGDGKEYCGEWKVGK
jgi:hypothetical protein